MAETIITISAKNKPLGRLATEAALILRGKNRPDFAWNKVFSDKVVIKDLSEIKITGKKLTGKTYTSHTGWPGGFKRKSMAEIIAKKGLEEVVRRAIAGMLPKNRLRKEHLKRLSFK